MKTYNDLKMKKWRLRLANDASSGTRIIREDPVKVLLRFRAWCASWMQVYNRAIAQLPNKDVTYCRIVDCLRNPMAFNLEPDVLRTYLEAKERIEASDVNYNVLALAVAGIFTSIVVGLATAIVTVLASQGTFALFFHIGAWTSTVIPPGLVSIVFIAVIYRDQRASKKRRIQIELLKGLPIPLSQAELVLGCHSTSHPELGKQGLKTQTPQDTGRNSLGKGIEHENRDHSPSEL